MVSSPENADKEKLQTLDALAYKLFVKKFNEQYGNSLLTEQKELLTKYVMSFADNGIEFKIFLNEEIERLKSSLTQSLKTKEISQDKFLNEKTNVVLKKVEEYAKRNIDQQMVQEILKIQSLTKELDSQDTIKNG
jgi:translation elongation factor EF-4